MLLANIFEQGSADRQECSGLAEQDADQREIVNVLGRLRRRIDRRSFMALRDTINDMEDLGMHDDAIAEALSTVKSDIIVWFEKQFAAGEGRLLTNELIHQVLLLVDIGLMWPELARVLENNKNAVMRTLLQYLKQDVKDNIVLMHIRGYIERFGKLGIRWPELRIVWNSIMKELKDHDLDENDNAGEEVPHWFAAIVDYIGDTDIAGAVNMCKTYNVNAKNTPMIANYMESNRWYLLRYLERCLGMSFQGFDEINKDIKGLRFIGVDWFELDTFYDDNKDKVMRLLLQQIKSEDEDAGFYTWQEINALRQAKVDWPELEIVMRGAMSLMGEKRDVEESTVDESSNLLPRKVQNVLDKTLRHVMSGGSYYLYTLERELLAAGASSAMMIDIFNMHKGVILHAIQRDLSTGNVQSGLNGIAIVNGVLMEKWPELANLAADNIDRLKSYLADGIGRSGWGYGFGNAVYNYEMLVKAKLDPSMLKELKTHMRDRMLNVLKDLIKNYGFNKQVLDGFESLEKLGVRVDLGVGKMKDKLMADFAAHLAKDGLGNEGSRFVKLVIKFGNEAANQEMKKVIEDNKAHIIRNMLRLFTVNAAYSVYPILTMLQHLGFKWDELRIIDKSVKSGMLENTDV